MRLQLYLSKHIAQSTCKASVSTAGNNEEACSCLRTAVLPSYLLKFFFHCSFPSDGSIDLTLLFITVL